MPKTYPLEQRERTIRMVLDRLGECPSVWAASQALGPKLGVGPETLRRWVTQAQVDQGLPTRPTSRLHGELGYLTPEEYEQAYYARPTGSPPGDAANKRPA